jgi:hypothetical protein
MPVPLPARPWRGVNLPVCRGMLVTLYIVHLWLRSCNTVSWRGAWTAWPQNGLEGYTSLAHRPTLSVRHPLRLVLQTPGANSTTLLPLILDLCCPICLCPPVLTISHRTHADFAPAPIAGRWLIQLDTNFRPSRRACSVQLEACSVQVRRSRPARPARTTTARRYR